MNVNHLTFLQERFTDLARNLRRTNAPGMAMKIKHLMRAYSLRSREDYKKLIESFATTVETELELEKLDLEVKVQQLYEEIEEKDTYIEQLETALNSYGCFVQDCRERHPEDPFNNEPENVVYKAMLCSTTPAKIESRRQELPSLNSF